MLKLQVIIGSTRPGRIGDTVGKWFNEVAKQHSEFEVELIDLAEVNLPFLDEPSHPVMQDYTKDHTKAWSKRIAAADAYVFVTSEYNHGYPAPLKNAIDYLNLEWRNKPVGFVAYGGVAAGSRSVEQLRQVVAELHMVSVRDAVLIPYVNTAFNEDGSLKDAEAQGKVATALLDDLAWWGKALKTARG
jgi:NAD(P)H-dependent FMN reductase